ncbi:methanethiol S-methyltransferase [Sphingomonas glaciei]|uniref:methanethiol S-methyltransferase n=1 Tax=Sphingomonas glaciei TaxID=2938948 RepID=A0ABY5MVC6_9SPHN|nr:methanethiol S-methyltransferase [Sphingomonas glaciei]UUR07384.1 isoprenylcysteine carboxylmethyltransferase family protein [Sphingomonas glaciei]
MARMVQMGFALVAYAVFFATFLYLIAFVGDLPIVPVTVDRGPEAAPGIALAVNLGLIALFGLQHSAMARQGFKRWWTGIVPPAAERSVYVLAASLMLMLLFWGWRPMTATIWQVDNAIGAAALWTIFAAGWAIVLLSTFLINHFELFGLQQAWFALRDRAAAAPQFRQPFFYRFVRHPLYSGFFLAFWATPHMTAGHLLLAAGMAAWMLLAIRAEEKDLVAVFGPEYEEYRARVGMLAPGIGRTKVPRTAIPAE